MEADSTRTFYLSKTISFTEGGKAPAGFYADETVDKTHAPSEQHKVLTSAYVAKVEVGSTYTTDFAHARKFDDTVVATPTNGDVVT